ncbi:hypothetical protein DY000_02024098 [Brassica cretica]|uniref:Replication protein A 70 kDa DNA-binding subunit B/D first OB fold domain-containing protein n=1 Tax=Brassica cretica TaxID=69181 RepID=A0ABQ7E4T1_BRACR|nr:hypothetical protein DY000_02024098 [Brassica cretica]
MCIYNSLIPLSFNHLLENVSLCLSSSSNRRPGVRHSTFESLRLGRSSQSIAFGFLRFWDSLTFKKDREFVGITVLFLDEKVNSVIHGFTPVGLANHYMPSLKAGSIVKVDRFEVAMCSSMYKITDHPFLIRFISLTVINEVVTGAPEINLQSRLDCSKSPSDCEQKPRTLRALTSPKKQLESLSVSSLIRRK